jgi:hypothetical protein
VKRCLVIGNGPSLRDIPNEFLDKYPTFGGNRIYIKYVPTYYASVCETDMLQFVDDINRLECQKYISTRWSAKVKGAIPLRNSGGRNFSTDPLNHIHENKSIVIVMLQLAYWMGYEQVGLIGVDHRYTGKLEQDHFSKHYLPVRKTKWRKWSTGETTESFKIAKQVFEDAGREIVNLTPNSALDVFRCEDWRTW